MTMFKNALMFSLLLTSTVSFAGDVPSEGYMSLEEQTAYITEEAKQIRKSYWVKGYKDISSSETFMTKSLLDEHVKSSNKYETYLEKSEVSQLYKCYHSPTCELYLVEVGGSYFGGYGEVAHFVLLYTKSKKSFIITHIIYAE